MLFDAEHSPSTLPHLHAQLAALTGGGTASIVRVPGISLSAFKHYLDLGVAGLMVPNVASAEDAALAVSYTRYPPRGVRGIAGTVRATNYGRDGNYLATAEERISLIAQIESARGIDRVDAIARTDGVDAVFIGPNDLAADIGHLGEPRHPAVVAVVEEALRAIRSAGKSAGVLCGEPDCSRYVEAGATMVALGSDLGLMVRAADALAARLIPIFNQIAECP